MYFDNFPTIYYPYTVNGQEILKAVTDVTVNVRIRKIILENITLFDEYDMREGETPEIVAAKLYGSSQYHWVVMLCNQRYDYLEDFPKAYHVFKEYLASKYTPEQLNEIHHYVLKGTEYIVSYDPADEDTFYTAEEVEAVSNYQHEENLNEAKRRIKLIAPTALTTILKQFKSII